MNELIIRVTWAYRDNLTCQAHRHKRAEGSFGLLRHGLDGVNFRSRRNRVVFALSSGELLDRSKRLLQAVVDGHEFETRNLFSGQCEGREMKGIQSTQ